MTDYTWDEWEEEQRCEWEAEQREDTDDGYFWIWKCYYGIVVVMYCVHLAGYW